MTDETCSTCRYWSKHAVTACGNAETGDCRRSPPRIVDEAVRDDLIESEGVDNSMICIATRFPITLSDIWCGKHKPSAEALDARAAEWRGRERLERRARDAMPALPAFIDIDDDQPF